MRCQEIAAMLPAYAGEGDLPLHVRRHLSRCGECRSKVAQYAELAEALHALPQVSSMEPPHGLREALVAIPSEAGRIEALRSHLSRNRKTYAGLLVGVAGAAGAAVWRTRRQRPATA